jgi:hypothetical protein
VLPPTDLIQFVDERPNLLGFVLERGVRNAVYDSEVLYL